jgi:hypothetical protein
MASSSCGSQKTLIEQLKKHVTGITVSFDSVSNDIVSICPFWKTHSPILSTERGIRIAFDEQSLKHDVPITFRRDPDSNEIVPITARRKHDCPTISTERGM